MSIIFPPAILGPKMAAPILWAPGITRLFLLENPTPIKFLVLGGGGFLERGGWKCRYYFYGRGAFLKEGASLHLRDGMVSLLVAQPLDPPPIALQGITIPIAPMFSVMAGYRAVPSDTKLL